MDDRHKNGSREGVNYSKRARAGIEREGFRDGREKNEMDGGVDTEGQT